VKFVLEVNLDELATDADVPRELGRMLRFWAGNLHHYTLADGDGSELYDSRYQRVGRWVIVDPAPPGLSR
jgi:hypothetical protein